MSFAAKLLEKYGLRPVFLYQLTSPAGTNYFTTHADGYTTTTPAATWTHKAAISHDRIYHTADLNRQQCRLTFPASDTFAQDYLGPVLADETELVLRELFANDVDQEAAVLFRGRWIATEPSVDTIKLVFENGLTAFRRKGQTALMQRSCRHPLYGPGCGLTRGDFELAGTATAYDAATNTVTVTEAAGQPDGDYSYGMLRFGSGLVWVQKHVGTSISLQTPFPGLADEITLNGTAAVHLAPGCNRSMARCHNRFNNRENHGGFELMGEPAYDGRQIV